MLEFLLILVKKKKRFHLPETNAFKAFAKVLFKKKILLTLPALQDLRGNEIIHVGSLKIQFNWLIFGPLPLMQRSILCLYVTVFLSLLLDGLKDECFLFHQKYADNLRGGRISNCFMQLFCVFGF